MNPEMMSGGGGSSYSLASEAGGNDTFGFSGPSFSKTTVNSSNGSMWMALAVAALVIWSLKK